MEIYQDHSGSATPAPRSSRRGAAVVAGSVLAGALLAGGGAYAMADPTPGSGGQATTTAGSAASATAGQRQELGRPLHGEMVMGKDGTYTTVRMQEGTVTAKTATSLTVKSADGYEQTYSVGSDTRFGGGPGMGPGMGMGGGPGRHGHHGMGGGTGMPGATSGTGASGTAAPAPTQHTFADVKVGDTVHVMATVKDGTATAVAIGEEAWRPAGMPRPDRDGDEPGAPSASATGTAGTPGASASATTGTQG